MIFQLEASLVSIVSSKQTSRYKVRLPQKEKKRAREGVIEIWQWEWGRNWREEQWSRFHKNKLYAHTKFSNNKKFKNYLLIYQ